ncbi:MAG: hypothetical protein ACC642_12305, partial [Pseudomonadales bacterium]
LMTQQMSRLGIGDSAEAESWDEQGSGGGAGAGAAVSGDIRSSEDVLRMIDKICFYYDQREPSSPVPILLKRAASLVNKNFLDLVADLAPSGVSEAQKYEPGDGYEPSYSAGSGSSWGQRPADEQPAADNSE